MRAAVECGGDFVAGKSFGGAKVGFVFKKDKTGVGYYRDVGLQDDVGQSVGRGVGCATKDTAGGDGGAHVVIRLAEYLGMEEKSAATVAVEETLKLMSTGSREVAGNYQVGGEGGGRKRRRCKGRRATGGAEEDGGQEEVTAFNGEFKKMGLWAFDQINPNGGKGLINYLHITAADVVCSQEVKRFEGQPCAALESEARRAGWAMAVQACGEGKQGCPSAGTAVAARAHLGLAEVPGLSVGVQLKGRMSVKWLGGIARGGVFVGSIYLQSGVGMSTGNLRLLEEAAKLLMSLPGPWILSGDFQVGPTVLIESGFPRLAKGVVAAPRQATCHGNTIDYFVVSEGLAGSVYSVRTLDGSPFDPHSPVRLLLRAGAPRQRVRVQAKPFAIPRTLASGCLNSCCGEWLAAKEQWGGGRR